MEKIKAKIKVNDYKIEKEGTIDKGIIKVNDLKTIFTFDTNNLILTRVNDEINVQIDFKNKELIYSITEVNDKFIDNFTILSLTNKDKEYNIKYQMGESVFILDIKYETIK